MKEFCCYFRIFGFCQSRLEVLSLVFAVAVVFVVKLKTCPSLKGKLLQSSLACPALPLTVVSPQTLHSANFWTLERIIRT